MKFLILLFVAFAFADSHVNYYYEDTGEYSQCVYDCDRIEVNIYAGNAFINATVLPDLCYQISIGILGAVVIGYGTKMIIQNGKIISLITNGNITDYSNSTVMMYNSQVIFRETIETMDDWAIWLIVISLFLAILIVITTGIVFIRRKKSAENIPLIKN
jgi:hypothetical protein